MYVSVLHVWLVPMEAKNTPGTRITEGCEPLWGCWELDLGPIEEQQCCKPLSRLSIPRHPQIDI